MSHTWYLHFQQFTPRSQIVPFPRKCAVSLQSGKIFLGALVSCDDMCVEYRARVKNTDGGIVARAVRHALTRFGGVAFIKLNWSCAKDASFMKHGGGGVFHCLSTRDVYLYLTSSDAVSHDIGRITRRRACCNNSRLATICAASASGHGMVLVLRNLSVLSAAMEFRCFILKGVLVAICQRHCAVYFPFLLNERRDPGPVGGLGVRYLVSNFCERVVFGHFGVQSYSADIYIDRKWRVWIVGFGVLGPPTNPLLFSWDEIFDSDITVDSGCCELRVVEPICGGKCEYTGSSENLNKAPLELSLGQLSMTRP